MLEALLEQARNGEIKGFLFAVRLGVKNHAMGLAGEYSTDLMMAAAVTSRMQHKLNTMADGSESSLRNGQRSSF